MTFPRVRTGQRLSRNLPALAVNGLFGLLEGQKHRESKGEAAGSSSDAVEILIQNKTGAPVFAGYVVEVGDVVYPHADNSGDFLSEHVFEGNVPSASSTKVAIIQEPLSADATGKAIVAGITIVKLNVSDSADTHASPTATTAELTTGTSGLAEIIWKESGTGTGKWAKVLLTGQPQQSLEYVNLYLPYGCGGNSFDFAADGNPYTVDTWEGTTNTVGEIQFPSAGVWHCTLVMLASVAPLNPLTIDQVGQMTIRIVESSPDAAIIAPYEVGSSGAINLFGPTCFYVPGGGSNLSNSVSIPQTVTASFLLNVVTPNVEAVTVTGGFYLVGLPLFTFQGQFWDGSYFTGHKLSD